MDEQVELLRGIWNEMKALNGRVDTTNERLVCVERGLPTTNEKLVDLDGGLSTRLDLLRDEMHSGFRGFSERIRRGSRALRPGRSPHRDEPRHAHIRGSRDEGDRPRLAR